MTENLRQTDTPGVTATPEGFYRFAAHLSPAERSARGRQARRNVPRKLQSEWAPAADRSDPVDLLLEQERTRVPGLLPLRHERMGASEFAFYRGTAIIMAADLASHPDSGLHVQLCGDAHLSNFGLFASPDRQPVFDLNDFDETHPGPFEWDLKRLAVSFALAARDNGQDDAVARQAVLAVAEQYRISMAEYAAEHEIDIWYERIDAGSLDSWAQRNARPSAGKAVQRSLGKAKSRTMWTAVSKLTTVVDGHRRFLDDPPVLIRIPEDIPARDLVISVVPDYYATLSPDRRALLERYEIVDLGHKVVGVGSVGLLAWTLLLEGRDNTDVLVLQVKQAQKSVLEPYTAPSEYARSGERVVQGQRLIQAASDSFLGWVTGKLGRDYYVRQLRDMKWSPDPANLIGERLVDYAKLCGHVLARAHARSGDAIALSGYMGQSTTFDESIETFSLKYAETVADDYRQFQEAVASGRLAGGESSQELDRYLELMRNPPKVPIN